MSAKFPRGGGGGSRTFFSSKSITCLLAKTNALSRERKKELTHLSRMKFPIVIISVLRGAGCYFSFFYPNFDIFFC